MYSILAAIVAALVLAAGVNGAVAQDRPPDRDKSRERMETLGMWRMMEALDLDKETADKIFEARRRFSGRIKELNKSIAEDFNQLRQMLNEDRGSANEKELGNLVESIRKKRSQISNLREERYKEVAKVLPVRKQAELVLFLRDFGQEMRRMMRRQQHQPGASVEGRMGPPPRPEFQPGGPPGGAPGGPPQSGPPRGRPGPPPGGPPTSFHDGGPGGPDHTWEVAEDADDF